MVFSVSNCYRVEKLESLGERIVWVAGYYGITVNAMNGRLGVAPSTTHGYLNEGREPKLGYFVKFSEVFPEIDLSWLITGKGDRLKADNEKWAALEKELTLAHKTIGLYEELKKANEDKNYLLELYEKNEKLQVDDTKLQKQKTPNT